uniref:Zinc transporter ZIP11 n=1 Tax=Oncorhynchus tshawytscha TaxID=74940 RepID=A0A8C8F0H5_ONCTS
MLPGYSPVTQALLGTLLTWGLTAAGQRILDGSLGFAAGVMLAASYWTLLAPAIDMAEDSGKYGSFAFVPVAVGFALGAAFVYLADLMMPALGVGVDPHIALALPPDSKLAKEEDPLFPASDDMTIRIGRAGPLSDKLENGGDVYQRRKGPYADAGSSDSEGQEVGSRQQDPSLDPKGLAVGVGFGAIGKTSSATFESARNLAIGIGIQNYPEGLAVSLPLRGAGMSTWKAFWYGQLSGMVEPIAGLLGAVAMVLVEPLLPYALAFAAGAMVYVVVDDIIPEAQLSGNGTLASWTSILGFVVMMSLDVGLG